MSKASLASALRQSRVPAMTAIAGALAISPACAQEWQAGAVVTVAGQYVTNPFLDPGKARSTVAGQGDIRPFVEFNDNRTKIRFDAYANAIQYGKYYGLEDNYGTSLRVGRRLSPSIDLNSLVKFDYIESRLGSLNVVPGEIGSGSGPVLPPVDPSLPDVALLGARARATSLEGSVVVGVRFDERNRVELEGGGRAQWFVSPRFTDYENFSGELRYFHRVSSRVELGAIAGASWTNYESDIISRGRSKFVLGSASFKLGSRYVVDLAAGMSFSRDIGAPGQLSSRFNALTVRGNLCRTSTLDKLCASYRRWPQPTAFGGVRVTDTFLASYDRKLSDRDRMAANVSYLRTSQGRGPVLGFTKLDFLGGSTRYERSFNQRITGFVQVNAGKLWQPGLPRELTASVTSGVTIRLGSLR